MKFFVDTADVDAIRELNDLGMVDGVTTNPSLILKSGRDILEVTKEICSIVSGPVSAEVVALTADEMIAEGRKLAEIAPNITVKVPLTWDGLKTCKTLSSDGHMVNVTLCFSANQALLAAKAGATPGEVAELLGVALLMDGGTASVYAPRAWEAFMEFHDELADATPSVP